MLVTNKFDNPCSACMHTVHSGEGFAVEYEGDWYAYHKDCLPAEFAGQVSSVPKSSRKNCITAEGHIFIDYNAAHIDLIKTIPNRKWNKENGCWSFPLSVPSIERAVEVGRILNLKIDESLNKTVPVAEKCRKYDKMYQYQKEGAEFLASRSAALLGDEMGTGKTIQTLCALPKNSRVLVVCPSSLKFNWVKECNFWRPDYKVTVLSASKINIAYEAAVLIGKNNFRLPEKNEIFILNREMMPDSLIPNKAVEGKKYKICDLPQEFLDVLQETYIIVDEAHRFKGTKTSGYKKLKTLTKNARATWALTGTPLLNRPTDLWGVLSACNMENVVFNKYGSKPYDYFYECFNGRQGRFGIEWGDPTPEVPDLISRVRLARKRKDVLPQLPEKTYTNILVTFDGQDGSVITKELDDLSKKYSSDINLNKLPPFQAFSAIRHKIAKSRIPALVEYVEECEEQDAPLVVFSAHKAPLDILRIRDGWAVIDGSVKSDDKQKIVDDFQNGKLKGIGCTIQCGAEGLNLTRAWKCLFVDLDWVPALNLQAEARINRIGQTSNKIEIIRFVGNHPLDEHLFNLLAEKERLIQATFEKPQQDSTAEAQKPTKNTRSYTQVICDYESSRASEKPCVYDESSLIEKASFIVSLTKDDPLYFLVSRTDVKAINTLLGSYRKDPLFVQALSFIVGRYEKKFSEIKTHDQ